MGDMGNFEDKNKSSRAHSIEAMNKTMEIMCCRCIIEFNFILNRDGTSAI